MPQVLDLSQMQAAVAALVGLVLPIVLAVPIQYHWASSVKALFSLSAYGLAAVVTAVAAGQLTGATWWQSAIVIFVTGATSHQSLWKPSGISEAIEIQTTPAPKVLAAAGAKVVGDEALRVAAAAAAIDAARQASQRIALVAQTPVTGLDSSAANGAASRSALGLTGRGVDLNAGE